MSSNYYTLEIVCETTGCVNEGQILYSFDCSPFDLDIVIDSWTGDCEKEYCPVCGNLGILQEPYLSNGDEHENINNSI